MASEPDGEGSYHKMPEDRLKGVQKLASKLQKAVTKGRTSGNTMQEADRYIGNFLTFQIGQILQYLDDITTRAAKLETKEKLGNLYLRLMNSFKSIKAMEGGAYAAFARTRSSLDVNALSDLIEIDSELATVLSRMSHWLSRHRGAAVVGNNEVLMLGEMVDLLQDNVNRRESMVQKNKK